MMHIFETAKQKNETNARAKNTYTFYSQVGKSTFKYDPKSASQRILNEERRNK